MKECKEILQNIAIILKESTSKEEAIKNNHDKYLRIDYSSVYGGYRLVNVKVNGGGHSYSFLGSSSAERLPLKTFKAQLLAVRSTLNYIERNK